MLPNINKAIVILLIFLKLDRFINNILMISVMFIIGIFINLILNILMLIYLFLSILFLGNLDRLF